MRIVYFIIISTFTFKISKNQGLSNSLSDMNNVLGAKNLVPNNAVSQTMNGITFTVNSDGSVTVNGTASVTTYLNVCNNIKLDNIAYTLTGCPEGGGAEKYEFQMRSTESDSSQWQFFVEYGNGITFPADPNRNYSCFIGIQNGQTVSNLTFYPMLRPASIEDDTYVPYSMTNREMTPYVQAISNPNLLDNPWFTVNQRGQSSYSGVAQYTVDRWHSANTLTVDVSTGMVDITDSSSYWGYFDQYLEESIISLIYGKTLTLSVLLEDGEILSETGTMPSEKPSQNAYMIQMSNVNGGMNYQFTYEQNLDKWRVSCVNRPNTHNTKKVRAVKLELGSISTLAMDTAPNYASELLKCQRYYEQNKWYSWCVQANIDGFFDIMTTYPFLVQKRVNSITTNILKQNIGNGQLLDLTTSTFIPSSEITIAQPTFRNSRMENIKIMHNSIIRGHTYYFSIGDDCIGFSADL